MTHCPTDGYGVAECVNVLLSAFSMRGRPITVDKRPPAGPPTRRGPVKYTCNHGNSYWITLIEEAK